MNAAILLVSSAWMAGQTPEMIIPVNHAHSASTSCGSGCGSACCDSGPRLFDRIRGLFHRNNDCCDPCPQTCSQPRCRTSHWPRFNLGHRCESSCDSCGRRHHHATCDNACKPTCVSTCKPTCVTTCKPACDNTCKPSRHHRDNCCVQRQNDCCDDGCGGNDLFGRIRSMFHRDRGCNAGCNTGCCTSGGTSTHGAEPLKDQPKKMPGKSTDPKKGQEARVITPPAQAPLPAIQNAPTIAPAVAPRITNSDSRNPF